MNARYEPFGGTAPLTAVGLRVGTRVDDGCYVGVLRRGRTVVLECGHRHNNRDITTKTNGISASECMKRLVWAARKPFFADEEAATIANAWLSLTRSGCHVPTSTIEQAKAEAPANVAAYRERIAKVAELLGLTVTNDAA